MMCLISVGTRYVLNKYPVRIKGIACRYQVFTMLYFLKNVINIGFLLQTAAYLDISSSFYQKSMVMLLQ